MSLASLRRWLGPLGRYRPGLLRRNMAAGFRNCDRWSLPDWARLPSARSPEERLLEALDLAGKTVYDVGAFTGAYTLFFSRQVGATGRVVAFEPHASSFATLIRNLEGNQICNVLPLRLALGARAETRTIFMLPGMPTTASLDQGAHTPLRRSAGEVEIARLDDLMAAVPLPPPDFIKVDVEGLELDLLAGASATLGRHRPALLIEVHGASRGAKAARIAALAQSLQPLGYRLTHAESGAPVAASSPLLCSGHLYARVA
ncbi:MAG: FkbM family methyltransferase [Terriglobales bacterium]